ncbi:MAG: S8 family serine peptidase [Flavobacteriales bacterium]
MTCPRTRTALAALASFGILLFNGISTCHAQLANDTYLVELADKTWGASYPFTLEAPEDFLSERALERRARQGVSLDSLDLPVSPEVLEVLDALPDWQVVHASKWMSSVTLAGRDSLADTLSVLDLSFVAGLKRTRPLRTFPRTLDAPKESVTKALIPSSEYGSGWLALDQLNAQSLHALGFNGTGLWVGVLDAGFQGADVLPAFESMRDEGRLVVPDGANVAFGGNDVFAHSRHGASVLGTMGLSWSDSLVGTAPGATYFAFVTEDVTQERRIEEEHWIVAAERADSLGIDLLNTSLGYSLFDDTASNYLTTQLDGATARISVASEIAATRGMLVVTSAGNNGDDPWRTITFPADAKDILSVGAVRGNGTHGWFSGFGPSADGRIKPEVMALGVQTPYPRFDGTVGTGNGTSFASPILCGAAASLWQAHPEATAAELRQAILASAHLYAAPNDSMGYGIPDMWRAHLLLGGEDLPAPGASPFNLFPNPTSSAGTLRWTLSSETAADWGGLDELHWKVFNAQGQQASKGTVAVWADPHLSGHVDLAPLALPPGHYTMVLEDAAGLRRHSATFVVLAPSR